MKAIDLFVMGLKNLWRRKLRTFLTVLGVIIGTASIVIMMSLGFGMTESFQQQLSAMGNLHVITVNPSYSTGSTSDDETLELDDEAVSTFSMIEGVQAVTPILQTTMRMVSGRYIAYVNVMGIQPETMQYFDYDLSEGRLLEESDTLSVVFGSEIAGNFYNPKEQSRSSSRTISSRTGSNTMVSSGRSGGVPSGGGPSGGGGVPSGGGAPGGGMEMPGNTTGTEESEDPVDVLNDKLEITFNMDYGQSQSGSGSKQNGQRVYKVSGAGVLNSGDYSTDYYVFMPLAQVQKMIAEENKYQRLQGSKNSNEQDEYSQILIKVENLDDVSKIQEQITEMGYNAYSLNDTLESMQETASTLQAVLGGIGAVSLFVAALGITNTMIMSIYERTREIGIMKVIGAALSDIRKLFLLEAAVIGFLGGVTGIALSCLGSYILNHSNLSLFGGGSMESSISVIPLWLALASVAFSTMVGILSGFYPARRAMKLSALEAIKTE